MRVETIDLEFQGQEGAIASFLVEGSEGFILVETGPESTRPVLLETLQKLGVDPRELAAIFVTHIHLDHAGAAGWFAAHGIPVHVHPKGARHLVDPSRLVESARMVYGEAFDTLWGGMTPAPAESIREIYGGEHVEAGGIRVEAVETPGHAFHHHAYLVGDDLLFAGDAAGARVDDSGYLSVTSAPPQFHLEHTLASLERLDQAENRRIILTHFGEIPEASDHLARYRSSVEESARFVKERLDEGMDDESLRVAYQAFQMERAFRHGLPREKWDRLQLVNGTDMCADGIRLYWQKREENAS